jgi:hypothetical protein
MTLDDSEVQRGEALRSFAEQQLAAEFELELIRSEQGATTFSLHST